MTLWLAVAFTASVTASVTGGIVFLLLHRDGKLPSPLAVYYTFAYGVGVVHRARGRDVDARDKQQAADRHIMGDMTEHELRAALLILNASEPEVVYAAVTSTLAITRKAADVA